MSTEQERAGWLGDIDRDVALDTVQNNKTNAKLKRHAAEVNLEFQSAFFPWKPI